MIEALEEQNILEIETGEVYKSGDNKGQAKTKRGQYYDKLTNLITRLRTKMDDKKYGFVFNEEATIMLPSKILLDKPKEKPKSATIDFWDRWYDGKQTVFDLNR